MQLFSIGLWGLNEDGTLNAQVHGKPFSRIARGSGPPGAYVFVHCVRRIAGAAAGARSSAIAATIGLGLRLRGRGQRGACTYTLAQGQQLPRRAVEGTSLRAVRGTEIQGIVTEAGLDAQFHSAPGRGDERRGEE